LRTAFWPVGHFLRHMTHFNSNFACWNVTKNRTRRTSMSADSECCLVAQPGRLTATLTAASNLVHQFPHFSYNLQQYQQQLCSNVLAQLSSISSDKSVLTVGNHLNEMSHSCHHQQALHLVMGTSSGKASSPSVDSFYHYHITLHFSCLHDLDIVYGWLSHLLGACFNFG